MAGRRGTFLIYVNTASMLNLKRAKGARLSVLMLPDPGQGQLPDHRQNNGA